MRHLVVAAAVLVALATFALATAPVSTEHRDWRLSLQRVDDALSRGDRGDAARAWDDAYAAALASRSWQAWLDVGDASVRIGDVTRLRQPSLATARRLYLNGFVRARAERSVNGTLDAAERFEALGDREVATQCLESARALATDAATIAYVDARVTRPFGAVASGRTARGDVYRGGGSD